MKVAVNNQDDILQYFMPNLLPLYFIKAGQIKGGVCKDWFRIYLLS